jgi:hypothetical protein
MALFYGRPELRLKRMLFSKTFPVNGQATARTLYKKLLALYPREFREQLGKSTQQTFNDIYKERKQQTKGGMYGGRFYRVPQKRQTYVSKLKL